MTATTTTPVNSYLTSAAIAPESGAAPAFWKAAALGINLAFQQTREAARLIDTARRAFAQSQALVRARRAILNQVAGVVVVLQEFDRFSSAIRSGQLYCIFARRGLEEGDLSVVKELTVKHLRLRADQHMLVATAISLGGWEQEPEPLRWLRRRVDRLRFKEERSFLRRHMLTDRVPDSSHPNSLELFAAIEATHDLVRLLHRDEELLQLITAKVAGVGTDDLGAHLNWDQARVWRVRKRFKIVRMRGPLRRYLPPPRDP